MPRLFFTLPLMLLVALASPLAARCNGENLLPGLSPDEAAQMQAGVAATPYAQGNHWRAEYQGRVISVIGTMHADDPRLDPIMARLAPLIDAADLVLVEATAEEETRLQAAIATQPELAFLTTGPTLPDLLDEATWQAVSEAASARGVPPFMAAKFQPWYLMLVLSVPPCMMRDVAEGARGLDHRIMARAEAASVPLRAVEPYDTLIEVFAEGALDQQLRYLRLSILTEAQSENAMATLMESYFTEQTAEAWQFSRINARRLLPLPAAEIDALIDEVEAKLLVARNRAWMPTVLQAEGDRIVLAVGAAHLIGDEGVLNLLAEAGWSLTRQPF